MTFRTLPALLALALLLPASPASADAQLERGLKAIESMAGCYMIDYSYTETEGLKPGYQRDHRVYDVNKDKTVKEWIVADRISPTRIRLQHVLFMNGLDGTFYEASLLKHTGEDWEYNAPFRYEFTSPLNWLVKDLSATPGLWTRKVTNLDDGLRYQCSAAWSLDTAYPEWSCGDNFAPIPGRETRDMGRKDYNTLDRSTRIMAYGGSWLERQENTKTIYENGTRTPLAKELGKHWYVRLPDSDCAQAKAFTDRNWALWTILRQTWDEVLVGDRPFVEKAPARGEPSRFARMMMLESKYRGLDLSKPEVRAQVRSDMLAIIGEFRAN